MRRTIFHENWWLNAVAGDAWKAVTLENSGKLVGYFPFIEQRSRFFNTCRMPQLTRVLGPLVRIEGRKQESWNRASFSILTSLFREVEAFDHVNFTIAPGYIDVPALQFSGFTLTPQATFQINCRQAEEVLWANMRDKTRNLIRRAEEKLDTVEWGDAAAFADFYAKNLGGQTPYFDISVIAPIHAAVGEQKQGKILAALDKAGEPHAMIFLIWDEFSSYYFLSTRNRAQSDLGAVSLLVWRAMQESRKLGLTFDLDGVFGETQYKFLLGFGGRLTARMIAERNRPLFKLAVGWRALRGDLRARLSR